MPTHRAASATPFLETVAVEDVLAGDGKKACCVVHTFEADGAGGKFDKAGRGRWEWLHEAGCCGRRHEGIIRELWKAGVWMRCGRLEGY